MKFTLAPSLQNKTAANIFPFVALRGGTARIDGTRKRRAFSLIELLAVIAIIGALAVILIPVIGKVRLSADKAEASQMLRHLGMTIQLYISENEGQMPSPCKNKQYAYMPDKNKSQFAWCLRDYWDDTVQKGNDTIIPVLGYRRFFEEYDPTVTSSLAINSRVVIQYDTEVRTNPFENESTPYFFMVSDPSRQVAVMHLDAETYNDADVLIGRGEVPTEPLLEDGRMALFFDWHVEFMPLDYKLGEWTQ